MVCFDLFQSGVTGGLHTFVGIGHLQLQNNGGLRYIETAYRNVVSPKSGLSVRRYKVFLQIL